MKRSWLDFFANLLLAIAVTVFFAEALSRLIPNVWVHWSIPVLLAVGGLVHLERLSREGAHEQGVVIDAQDPKAARQWFQTEADEFLKQRFVKRWSLLVAGASIFSSFSLFALGFHWFGAQGEIEAAQKRLDGMDEQVKAVFDHDVQGLSIVLSTVQSVELELGLAMRDTETRKSIGVSWVWAAEHRARLKRMEIGLQARGAALLRLYLASMKKAPEDAASMGGRPSTITLEALRQEQHRMQCFAELVSTLEPKLECQSISRDAIVHDPRPFPEQDLWIAQETLRSIYPDRDYSAESARALRCVESHLLAARDGILREPTLLKDEDFVRSSRGEHATFLQAEFDRNAGYYLTLLKSKVCLDTHSECPAVSDAVMELRGASTPLPSDASVAINAYLAVADDEYRSLKDTDPLRAVKDTDPLRADKDTDPLRAGLAWTRGQLARREARNLVGLPDPDGSVVVRQQRGFARAREFWIDAIHLARRIKDEDHLTNELERSTRDPSSLNSLAWQYANDLDPEAPASRNMAAIRYAKLALETVSNSNVDWLDRSETSSVALAKAGFSFEAVRSLYHAMSHPRGVAARADILGECGTLNDLLKNALAEYRERATLLADGDPTVVLKLGQLLRIEGTMIEGECRSFSAVKGLDPRNSYCAARRAIAPWSSREDAPYSIRSLDADLRLTLTDESGPDCDLGRQGSVTCVGAMCKDGQSLSLRDFDLAPDSTQSPERAMFANNWVWDQLIRTWKIKDRPAQVCPLDLSRAKVLPLVEAARDAVVQSEFQDTDYLDTLSRVAVCAGDSSASTGPAAKADLRGGLAAAEFLLCREQEHPSSGTQEAGPSGEEGIYRALVANYRKSLRISGNWAEDQCDVGVLP
jgi:hypothetical protein